MHAGTFIQSTGLSRHPFSTHWAGRTHEGWITEWSVKDSGPTISPASGPLTEVHNVGHSVHKGEPDNHVAHKLVELDVLVQRQDLSQPRGPQPCEAAPEHQHLAGKAAAGCLAVLSSFPSSCLPELGGLPGGAPSPSPQPPSLGPQLGSLK